LTLLSAASSPSFRPRAAIAAPSASGTASASASHTRRTIHDGTACGMGTKASANAATLGAATPSASSGHTTAAPTMAERIVWSRGVVRPNSA
jgi:hypothetical protein